MSLNINKKNIIVAIIPVILISCFFIFSKMGLIGNSDTQLGVNMSNIFFNIVGSWRETNSGQEFTLPGFFPVIFQIIFNLFNTSFSNPAIIMLVFLALLFTTFKLTCYLLDVKDNKAGILIIFIMSLFSINNDYVMPLLIICSTMIWAFFFFILSIYFFFRYHFEKKFIYLLLLMIVLPIMFVDFHMVLLTLMFIFSYLFVEFFYEWIIYKKINSNLIKEIIIIAGLFLLVNSDWILINIGGIFSSNRSLYADYVNTGASTDSYLQFIYKLDSPSSNFIISQVKYLGSSMFIGIDTVGSYIIPILIIASLLFIKKEKNEKVKKTLTILIILYIIFFSFSLGQKNPLGVFDFFWRYAPAFKIFRNFEKFQRLLIPLAIILSSYSLLNIIYRKKSFRKIIMAVMLIVMGIKFIPFATNLRLYLPYKIPDYYYNFYEFTKENKLQKKIQLLPIVNGYSGFTWSNQSYDMQEPILYFTNTPIFMNSAAYEKSLEQKMNDKILESLLANDRKNLIAMTSMRNSGYFLIRKDLQQKIIDKYKIDIEKIFNSANKNLKLIKTFGELYLYSINTENFLPHFYTPKNTAVSKRTIVDLPRILFQDNYDIRSAVFFENQNAGKENVLGGLNINKNENLPTLELKKINLTKYRIRIHGASGILPLVFSENFHTGWKAYPTQSFLKVPFRKGAEGLDSYKILDGNEEDQASKDELADYINKGWVTELGKNIDFISKNFQGTIQNDNLPSGNIFETLFKKPIDESDHLMANGYANSWIIDTNKICQENADKCVKNADGSYDMEFVVEFWPQRIFYIGLGISGLTLLSCLAYIGYDWRRRRRVEFS